MINRPVPMPDTSLQNSLQWVHMMPQGQGQTPSVIGGPVVEYQTRNVQERTSGQTTSVVEWLYADIRMAHLDHGSEPNTAMQQWVQNEVGVKGDHAGHIVANRLGGLGTEKWNIFPQNSNINSGVNRAAVEDLVYMEVQRTGSVKVWYHFIYSDLAHPGRPSEFQIYFNTPTFPDYSGDLVNPLSVADARGSK